MRDLRMSKASTFDKKVAFFTQNRDESPLTNSCGEGINLLNPGAGGSVARGTTARLEIERGSRCLQRKPTGGPVAQKHDGRVKRSASHYRRLCLCL